MTILLNSKFILSKTILNWQELLYGFDKGWILTSDAVDIACHNLKDKEPLSDVELQLIISDDKFEIHDCISKLASEEKPLIPRASEEEPFLPDIIRDKWLYLVLSWLYEHSNDFDDPLAEVAVIYDDFWYPPQIESFVNYMPMQEPDLGSKEANKERSMRRWAGYLQNEKKRFYRQKSA